MCIRDRFMAGYVPGILMGLGCMVVAFIYAKKMGIKATGRDKSISVAKTIWDAIPSLLLIIIVIGGIVSGIFTATEGAGIAVLYCLILSIIYKSIDFKGFMEILLNSAKTSGIILFLISASSAMSFVMAYSGIPAAISSALLSVSTNKYVIFILMNVILLILSLIHILKLLTVRTVNHLRVEKLMKKIRRGDRFRAEIQHHPRKCHILVTVGTVHRLWREENTVPGLKLEELVIHQMIALPAVEKIQLKIIVIVRL